MKKIIFFRNDDVRNKLDDSLIRITNIFIENNIPITHAVEPANVTPAVVKWLIKTKEEFPNYIDIMQHGYDHINKINNPKRKGEFGGKRGYQEQFNDISKGKQLMDKYFGDLWLPVLNFPHGTYNYDAMRALNDVGFLIINSSFNQHWTRQLFYFVAHILRRNFFLGYRVPYNLRKRPKMNLFEIDNSVSFIKKYYSLTDCDFYSLEELINITNNYIKFKVVGVLFHHRYHKNEHHFSLIENYLNWVNENDFEILSMLDIYKKLNK